MFVSPHWGFELCPVPQLISSLRQAFDTNQKLLKDFLKNSLIHRVTFIPIILNQNWVLEVRKQTDSVTQQQLHQLT